MSTVLLTRPRAASERLAAELKTLGYDSVIEPLLTITLTAVPPPDLAGIKGVMITSGNALDALAKTAYNFEKLVELRCFCVGSHTAARARSFGFKDVHNARGDGDALAELIELRTDHHAQTILHISGNDIDSAAADKLRHSGYSIMAWSVYAAMPAIAFSSSTIDSLQNRRLDAVVVFSTRTAETLKALLTRHALEACCESLIAIGMSEAVLAALKPLPWQKTAAAAEPTEEAVIARLQKLLPVSREPMTDTPAVIPSPPASETLDGSLCRKKKPVRRIITALFILALVAIPASFYFCPWLANVLTHGVLQNSAQAEAHLTDIDRRVQLLENRFQELSGRVSSTPVYAAPDAKEVAATNHAAELARMQSDLVGLSSALGALRAEVKQSSAAAAQAREATQALLASAITFIQLREAALSGHSFTDELTAFRTAAGNDLDLQKSIAQLEPYAAEGAPSFSELHQRLLAHEAGAANAIEKAQAQNWWQRITAELKGLVSVRSLHGNEVSDRFAVLEAALDKNDAAAALEAYKNLAPEAQQALADWHARLEARAAIDDTLHRLAVHFTNSGTPAPAQDTP
jgi:uroporphyrinogen-III synthase